MQPKNSNESSSCGMLAAMIIICYVIIVSIIGLFLIGRKVYNA